MITSQLAGGLGNQLFQYSAGRSLALQHNVNLRLLFNSNSQSEHNNSENSHLSHFNIQALMINRIKPIEHILPDSFINLIKGGFPKTFRETQLRYDERFARLGLNTRLKGYWQSERYFKKIEKKLRNDLKITTPPSNSNAQLLQKIASLPAVSVHIRRGDYVTNPEANAYHGTCDLNYYSRAMAYVRNHMIEDPVIFVFSDDPFWAKENFNSPFETIYVDINSASTCYEDLRLMACCEHNIIANSSFSWWGAWLNQNSKKIVVAPNKWYSDPTAYNPDILPEAWWAC